MIRNVPGACRRSARLVALVLVSALLASCGSGGVSNDNATAPGTGPVSISPASATLYSELPTTFSLSGGSGSYLVTSSAQAVIPVASNVRINSLVVVPADVGADTEVTLTVRDANDASATPASAVLTVKPRTITNLTVTPSPQSPACGSAICSGGEAEVTAVLAQAGIPLANRDVRFDVVSGDVRIIGTPDPLSGVTTTDGSGTARVRIRVLPGATSQTALLRITDLASGFTQTTSVAITSTSNAPLSAQPPSISFTGPDANTCANNSVSATVIVSGGSPPYTISQPGEFSVSQPVVVSNGWIFTVTPTGVCSTGALIGIVDANGASTTVEVNNSVGSVPVPPFVVAPKEVTFTDCGQQAGVVAAGGTRNYVASKVATPVVVSPPIDNVFTLSIPSKGVTVTGDVDLQVGISDGQTALPVTVHLKGPFQCPP